MPESDSSSTGAAAADVSHEKTLVEESSPRSESPAAGKSVVDSPLKQVNAGENNDPAAKPKLKVVSLYEQLFTSAEPHSAGYWVEFFLLPVDVNALNSAFNDAQPLWKHAEVVQTVVRAAIANLASASPQEYSLNVVRNALQVLQSTFSAVLKPEALDGSEGVDLNVEPTAEAKPAPPKPKGGRKGTRTSGKKTRTSKSKSGKSGGKSSSPPPPVSKPVAPSVISTLCGLEKADEELDELAQNVLALLRSTNAEVVSSTVEFMLVTARMVQGTQLSGVYNRKNFFAALLDVVDRYTSQPVAYRALEVIGILTTLNVYDDDSVPVYQQRISDYVDERVMLKMIALEQRLLRPQPTSTAAQSTGNRLFGWLGFGRQPNADEEKSKQEEDVVDSAFLLPLFFFVLHNPIFCTNFAASPSMVALMEYLAPQFSQLSKHQQQHSRSWLGVVMLRQLVDSEFGRLVEDKHAAVVRIAAPKLDLDSSRRVPLCGVLDLAQVGLRACVVSLSGHGRHLEPDFELLDQFAGLLYQSLALLANSKRMWSSYNYSALFKFVLGLVKYLLEHRQHLLEPIIARLLNLTVGVALCRDQLDEEDWTYIVYTVVKMPQLFVEAAQISSLSELPSLAAAKEMTAQYELNPEQPDLSAILKHGRNAAGGECLKILKPPSTQHPQLRRAVLQQI